MIPQHYRLWCAEISDGEITSGYVLGWRTNQEPDADVRQNDQVLAPIVAFLDEDGQAYWTGVPATGSDLCYGDSRPEVVAGAKRALAKKEEEARRRQARWEASLRVLPQWPEVLAEVKRLDPHVGLFVQIADLVSATNKKIVFTLTEASSVMLAQKAQGTIEDAASKVLGEPWTVEPRLAEQTDD